MFGGFRKKITQQTLAMVRQPYAVFQRAYGVPPGFWDDEFVLGFFGVMIGLVSQTLGEGRLSQTDKGYLLQETFGGLSNLNGEAVTRRFAELVHRKPQSAAFALGADNGEIVTWAFFGKGTPKGRAVIEEAKKEAEAQGGTVNAETVLPILAAKLFIEPLTERFAL